MHSQIFVGSLRKLAPILPPKPETTRVYELADNCKPFKPVDIDCKTDGSVVIRTSYYGLARDLAKVWLFGFVVIVIGLVLTGNVKLLLSAVVFYMFFGVWLVCRDTENHVRFRFRPGEAFCVGNMHHVICRLENDPGIYYWSTNLSAMRLFREGRRWYLELDDAFPEAPPNEVLEEFQFRNVFSEKHPGEVTLADGALLLSANSGDVRVMNRVYDTRREWKLRLDSLGQGLFSQANENRIYFTFGQFSTVLELLPNKPFGVYGNDACYYWMERSMKFVPVTVRNRNATAAVAS